MTNVKDPARLINPNLLPPVALLGFGAATLIRGAHTDLAGLVVTAALWFGLSLLSRPGAMDKRVAELEAKVTRVVNKVGGV